MAAVASAVEQLGAYCDVRGYWMEVSASAAEGKKAGRLLAIYARDPETKQVVASAAISKTGVAAAAASVLETLMRLAS